MLRSKIKLFKKGDELICIHDAGELSAGDVVTVWDICSDCLGLLFQGYQIHYQDSAFELYSKEKKFHFQRDPAMIEKKKVAAVFTDLIKVIMLNAHRGVFMIDPAIQAIVHNVMILGIDPEFRMPTNEPEPKNNSTNDTNLS